MKNIGIVDKYISKQLIDTFLLGIIIFTTIMFASDTFLNLFKQISEYGISFKIALLIVILNIPSILVLTIPMGVLLSTILTFNKLSLNSEITIMKACGISITRLAVPVIIFGISAGMLSFFINEYIVPVANIQTKNLTIWALKEKNMPEGKANFSLKELNNKNQLKRLFYVDNYSNKQLRGVTILDMSRKDAIQIIQSKYGNTTPDYWQFNQGVLYTISNTGKTLNTTAFNKLKLFTNTTSYNKSDKKTASEYNFPQLMNYINKLKKEGKKDLNILTIKLHEKIAIPVTSILVALIGVPLAITRPRTRFNRGILFSILVIFCYYLIRAFSVSLGEAFIINPIISAWLPNIIIACAGIFLFYRKAYKI